MQAEASSGSTSLGKMLQSGLVSASGSNLEALALWMGLRYRSAD
jgi:hypothetical protein